MASKFKRKNVEKRSYKKKAEVLKFSHKLQDVFHKVEQYLNIIRAKLGIIK